jgi:hypothetical protein
MCNGASLSESGACDSCNKTSDLSVAVGVIELSFNLMGPLFGSSLFCKQHLPCLVKHSACQELV